MNRTLIREPVRNYIVDNFLLGAGGDLDDSTLLVEAGILDSLAVAELVAFLEEKFNIRIDNEEINAQNLNSLEYIDKFVSNKLIEKRAA